MVTISEAMTNAFRAYQAGKLFEAEWICQQIVDRQADHVPALHLLGAIAYQTSRLETAIARYQQVLTLHPDHAEAQGNLAVALHDRGETEAAERHFQRALALNPNHAPTHFNYANFLQDQNQLEAAISHYQQAIGLRPHYPTAFNNLGNALRQQERLEEAIACYQQAIDLNPENPQYYNNLGNILQQQGRMEAAIAYYRQALTLHPHNPEVRFNLGNGLRELHQVEAAIQQYQEAIALKPDRAEFHNNLALALQDNFQNEAAIPHFQQAIALQTDSLEAYNNLGLALYEKQDLAGAIVQYQQALALDPEFAEAHLNLGIALLASGNFLEGFREYEWRWHCQDLHPLPLRERQWDGSDLQGKTLLLTIEQGFGDAIQFIRYAPLLAERGARIVVECPLELRRLFSTVAGISQWMLPGETPPPYDFSLPLMSVPRVLGDTLETIPNQVPYLLPPETAFELPQATTPSSALKVGIVWASGKPDHRWRWRWYRLRSAPLALFLQLATVQVEWFSLQVGEDAADLAHLGGCPIVDLSPNLKDFADTAAAIAQLDLVISVDTAVAHLAGALGKPTWVLLPYAPDWRWMLHREDSPWYPTMRLFRQEAPGDWQSTISTVLSALENLFPSG